MFLLAAAASFTAFVVAYRGIDVDYS
jgi:hypothetical protein